MGNIAGLVAGLLQEDYDLIGRSLEDVIIEPVRSILIPGFDEVKSGSREAGALGGGISGKWSVDLYAKQNPRNGIGCRKTDGRYLFTHRHRLQNLCYHFKTKAL